MSKKDYHHGDLRKALLKAAWTMVSRSGAEGVSLRGIAREANVSHAAPYHHFEDREALLGAVAAMGFRNLKSNMEQAASGSDRTDPLGRLQAVGISYVTFATEHPQIFRLMFSGLLADRSRYEELASAATATWEVLSGRLGAGGNGGEQQDLSIVPLAAWSTVHGLAFLMMEGLLEDEIQDFGREEIARQVTLVLGRGLKSYTP